ncbi:MAG: DUF1559 domain-containing protein, partial [Pirellulaceae bacterium]|nr:DUF1559 domain-containing protein [Pirellulaceae bacterium]
ECANNLKELGQATKQLELNRDALCGYANRVPGYQTAAGVGYEAGWPVMILAGIGREDVWEQFRTGASSNVRIATFICPSDSEASPDGPVLSYVGNCGQEDAGLGTPPAIPPDWSANGALFRHYTETGNNFVKVTVTTDKMKDGAAHTFLLSERLSDTASVSWNASPVVENLFGFLWRQGVTDTDCRGSAGIAINATPPLGVPKTDLPSSYHPGGVNVLYCDGHVDFLDENVEYRIYALQMTPDGGDVWAPGVARSDSAGQPPAWCRDRLGE